MPIYEMRYDNFQGGVWRSEVQEGMPQNTVRVAWNCRRGQYGSLMKRKGTEKIHTDGITATSVVVKGLHAAPFGSTRREVWMIDGENIHYLLHPTDSTFTSVGSVSDWSAGGGPYYWANWYRNTDSVTFVTQRNASSARIQKLDGSTLTEVSASPQGAQGMEVYKGRLWTFKDAKLYASAIDDYDTWVAPDGIEQPVGYRDATDIRAIKAVGESLLIFKRDSITRLTGTTPESLNIDSDAEGLSLDVGAVNQNAVENYGEYVFFLSEEGPYIGQEGGIRYIGRPVEHWMRRASEGTSSDAHATHNKRYRCIELWVTLKGPIGDAGRLGHYYTQGAGAPNYPNACFQYYYDSDTWLGPLVIRQSAGFAQGRHFTVVAAAPFSRSDVADDTLSTDGTLWLMHDSSVNAWACDSDSPNGYEDLMTYQSGEDGFAYNAVIELPELYMGDPSRMKFFHGSQVITADIDVNTQDEDAIQVRYWSEVVNDTTQDITVPTGYGSTLPSWAEYRDRNFLFRPALRGKRPMMQIWLKNENNYAELKAVQLAARMGRRWK